MRIIAVASAGVLLLAIAPRASAQQRQADSVVVRETLAAAFAEMAPDLAELVVARPAQAWRITLPKSSPAWISASGALMRLLNRTPAADTDRVRYLTVRELVVSDTLRTFGLTVGLKWRCPKHRDRWVASDRSFDVTLKAQNHTWARVAADSPILIGDPAVCDP